MAAVSIDDSRNLNSSKIMRAIKSNIFRSRCCKKNLRNPCKISPEEEQNSDEIWSTMRREAESDAKNEPLLAEYYQSAVLRHSSLESALASHLSLKLSDGLVSKTHLYGVFLQLLTGNREIQVSVREDLTAIKERDPAFVSYAHCFLHFKGFLACQSHRLAHGLYTGGRVSSALLVQSRASEVFGVDIHPKAEVGGGVVLDHATGIVVGETCVIGDGVTIYHGVTLGGTGKDLGDRHPKIGGGVVIGAGAKVLGNVRIGRCARIGAGAVVLKDVPDFATAVGNPMRLIGTRHILLKELNNEK